MSITYHRINLENVITSLRNFLEKKPNILIAILFGSATRRNLVRDLDIGMYFRKKPDLMEICKLIIELEDLTGIPVDLIPLDEAPPKLLQKIISQGIIITVKDARLPSELTKKALAEIMDIKLKLRMNLIK